MKAWIALTAVTMMLFSAVACPAAFLVEVDIDGADDGVLTYSPHFSYGADTTTASQSAASVAYGLTGGDSIFGGNGVNSFDTYVVTYAPDVDGDNLVIPAGTDLGEGNLATGLAAGGAGLYSVFAAWPFTTNVSGGLTQFTIDTAGDNLVVDMNQNDAADLAGTEGRGDVWVKLGEINYTSGSIVVTQSPTVANTFVSQRLAGVLFEPVPEPSTSLLAILAAMMFLCQSRRYGTGC